MKVEDVSPQLVKDLQDHTKEHRFIDVREVDEYEDYCCPRATNIPLSTLKVDEVLKKLDLESQTAEVPLYFICRSGGRSRRAAEMFYDSGYKNVFNVEGGMLLWRELGFPTKTAKT